MDPLLTLSGGELLNAGGSSTGETVTVNVFNGSVRTVVELRVGQGDWTPMKKVNAIDPKLQRTFDREAAILAKKAAWKEMSRPKPSTHLWQIPLPAHLPAGTHALEIRTTDRDGRVFHGRRILRVTP